MKKMFVCMLFFPILVIAASFVNAAPLEAQTTPAPLALALEYENSEIQSGPEPASLQLPAATEENHSDRRCMTVCSSWGDECVMISHSADVLSQKCVRTCQSFAEECL